MNRREFVTTSSFPPQDPPASVRPTGYLKHYAGIFISGGLAPEYLREDGFRYSCLFHVRHRLQ